MNTEQKQDFFNSCDRIDKIVREIDENDIGNCVKCGGQIYHTAQECGKFFCKNWDYAKDQQKNYCALCGEEMDSDTRQLCGKIICDNWDYVNDNRL